MIPVSFVAGDKFAAPGDVTVYYGIGQRAVCLQGINGNAEVTISAVEYVEADLLTYVTVVGGTLYSSLYEISLGDTFCNPANNSGNLCEHPHTGRSSGGYLAASKFSDPQVDNLQTIDIPQTADANKLLKVCPSASHGYQVATLQGMANRVSIALDDGQITVSTPQDSHTGASPTFAGLTLSGLTGIMEAKGASAIGVVSSSGSLQIFRRNATNTAYEFASVNLGELGDLNLTSAAAGDILFRNASDKWVNLAKGNDGDLLTLVSGLPAWTTVALKHLSDVADAVTDNGAVGDLMVRGASVYDRLPVGNDKQVLGVVSGSPAWRNVPDGDMFTLMMLCA